MIEPGTILADRYEIVGALGAGGMGTVFEAIDRRFGNRVAVKRLDITGTAVERAFEREARLLRDLKHDGLPRVIDHFEHERSAYLVMDYVGGEDLSQSLEGRSPFLVAEVVEIARAVLGILEYLHGRTPPILHRDIKPQNIKIYEGQVILLDFGLAKGEVYARDGSTGASSIAGYSPHYAPLEQIRGVGTDTWSDVYAVGASMYCLLTGSRPADALERAAAAATGAQDPLVPVKNLNESVPDALSDLLLRAMSPNPTHRPQDARALRRELEEALSGIGGVTVVEALRQSEADRTIIETANSSGHEQTVLATQDSPVGRRPARRVGRLTLVTAVTSLVVALGSAWWVGAQSWTSRPAHSSQMLVTGATAERDIAPGELHEYHVVARTGDAIRVALNRVEGRRFAVSIANPSGEALVEVRQGDGARLPAFWVARRDGVHVVSVRLSKNSGNGRYRLELEHLGAAAAPDLNLIRDQAAMLGALSFAEDCELKARQRLTESPGLPTERSALARAYEKEIAPQRQAIDEQARRVCLSSKEPMFEAWALEGSLRRDASGGIISNPDTERAIAIYRDAGDVQGEASFCDYKLAAELCATQGYRTGQARYLVRTALSSGRESGPEYQETLEAAFSIYRSLEDLDSLANDSVFLVYLGEFANDSERIRRFSEAIEWSRATGNAYMLADYLEGRSWSYERRTGEVSLAIADLVEAANVYRESKMPAHRIRTLRRLAAVIRKSGDSSRAETVLLESRTVDPLLGTLNDKQLAEEADAEASPIDPDPLRF